MAKGLKIKVRIALLLCLASGVTCVVVIISFEFHHPRFQQFHQHLNLSQLNYPIHRRRLRVQMKPNRNSHTIHSQFIRELI